MGTFWQHALNNPKTTLSGLCSFVGLTSLALIPMTHSPKFLVVLTVISALAKVYVAALSTDAGTVPALTPAGEIKAVPSHEVVDNPSDTPLKP